MTSPSSAVRLGLPLLLALAAALPPPARAAGTACDSLTSADVAGLGLIQVKPGAPGTTNEKVVTLNGNSAIMGRQTECLWQAAGGSFTLVLGDLDANLVKGADVARLGAKVLGSVREFLEQAATQGGRPVTFSPLAGVGEEAWTARMSPASFDQAARRGHRLVRLTVSTTPGVGRMPTPEQAGALAARVLSSGGGYTSAGAPPVKGEHPWAGDQDRFVVTGSILAAGALSGTYAWASPGAVEVYPDRVEVVLRSADGTTTMNLQVWAAEDRVQLRSGKLGAGALRGTGRTSSVDALAGRGSVSVDATVTGGGEAVTLHGTLHIKPAKR